MPRCKLYNIGIDNMPQKHLVNTLKIILNQNKLQLLQSCWICINVVYDILDPMYNCSLVKNTLKVVFK